MSTLKSKNLKDINAAAAAETSKPEYLENN
jgi:hypothetical protein